MGPPPPSEHLRVPLHDPVAGDLALTGRFADVPASDTLVMIVHGLGGSAQSHYVMAAARECHARGLASLRLNLRGADRSGLDFYHAGLHEDLRHVCGAKRLARFRRIVVIGYSLGGHISLRFAGAPERRVAAVATICAPIDIAAGVPLIDAPNRAPYRRHLLKGLKEMYVALVTRRPGAKNASITAEAALRIKTIREWDDAVVAPRFGFRDALDYYAKTSVHTRLEEIAVPTLVITANEDPMVRVETIRPWLDQTSRVTAIYTERGGHVGFPKGVNLGLGGRGSVTGQAIDWLIDPARSSASQ